MTKDEALKMAIEAMNSAYSSHGKILPSYPAQDAWLYHGCDTKLFKAFQACKEALEQQEIGDAEIKQMLNDIEYYQKRVEALEQEARLVSYAPDGSTCTLNIDGEEVYFNREQPAEAKLKEKNHG